ncbi:MAG TPA: right-handed parallel beta-helix repeat-containing protein, partial [Candidatus Thermoplasmatota archaeon]|nr:right-handed parallel beta-helix repeat-containing protein [Candidatus Thermoplasmatota archaeon]
MNAVPRWQKAGFAVLAVGILFGALVAQVDQDRRLAGTNPGLDPRVVTIDLDFLAADGSGAGGFYSLGPLGQVEVGRDPSKRFIAYTSGFNSVALVPAGTSYSGLDWWKGEAGSRPATADGVHARFEHLFPSTAADIVAGIDGVEFTLEIRSRPLVGVGALSYDFWLDASPGLFPAQAGRPLLANSAGVATVRGSIPIVDGAGRTVFVLTPATAFVEFKAASSPALGRSVSAYEAAFPAHEQGERQSVSLEYRLERVGSRTKVSVVLPADLFLDPAIEWPVRVDPGITNPIANSSYFADETILMDSDLVVTSTGAAQFSNVTLVMNRTASPNYNISVSQGGRMTLLSSTVKSNDSALPYKFTVNGSFTAQDTLIQHANDGLQLFGNSSTLSNVTLQNGTGRGLVLQGGNASMARVNIPSAVSTGFYAQAANVEAQFLNVTAAGGEGLYLNRTTGNVTWSHVLNATLNGAMVVNASRVNITNSEFAGSGRNGILVIGGSPSIENSTITSNNWSGAALFDDHSAYLYGNLVAGNNWSGIETRLNSTADLYANSIEGNAKAGVRVVASDPNIERNTIRGSEIGVWLEGAHNPGAKPGATEGTEDGYSYLMAASSELADGARVILVAGVSIAHQGPSTQADVPPGTIQFSLLVTNTDNAPPPVPIDLSIDDDESNWASLDTTSVLLAGGQSQTVTLTIQVPSDAQAGTTYSVLVWANESVPPFPQASVWAYVDLQSATALQVTNIQTGNQTTVGLSAILTSGGAPLGGKTVAFKLDGNWIGEAATDQGGLALLQYTVSQPPLSQVLLVYFNGTQYYEASSGSGYVNITWTATYLEVGNTTGRWGDTTELRARLVASPGGGFVMARKVYFSVNGTLVGTAYTDRLGNASLFFNDTVEPSTVAWNASFDGDPYAGDSSNASNFTSYKDLTQFEGPSFTIRQGETANHALRLTDDEGYWLASRTVHVKRGSTSLADVTTDASGYATYADTGAQSLTEGGYSMTYVFDGDDHYYTVTHYLTLTVRKWVSHFNATDQSEYYGDGGVLRAQMLDEDNGSLANKSVSVYLGVTLLGTVTTNETGWASYTDTAVRAARNY